ncbi:MAG: hypothetical protein IJB25_10445 [Clostridia bacterium]|nr:hypothetical protein [Clostridia bacterium]
MKIGILQMPYSTDHTRIEEMIQKELHLLSSCGNDLDIIVAPEYSDVPCVPKDVESFYEATEKYNKLILDKASETAKRTHSILFINALSKTETGYRNTTYAFDREGNIAGQYYKAHPVASEIEKRKLDDSYLSSFNSPTILEIEGLRFAFLTCYDFYFYESYARIALEKPDFVIGCSHQRSDPFEMSELFSAFCAFNTNAYVLRASVSMGENSLVGGGSLVASPEGKILLQMKNEVGLCAIEIDPAKKHFKPAGFGNAPSAHFEYMEKGRRPWNYRPAGSAIVPKDEWMRYPRLCAHRGFSTVAPENSMPAFGAAVALNASEIEFDLWETRDGEIVSLHDASLDRVSSGTGFVWDLTYEEIKKADFGIKTDERFKGLRIVLFEDILKKFSCQTIMNVHIKSRDNVTPVSESMLKKIIALIRKYDASKHVYFMTGNRAMQKQLARLAPDIARCMGAGDQPWEIVNEAIELNCQKVQLFKPYFDQAMIDKAHAGGIKCNVFFADDPKEAHIYLQMGIDCILTNDYLSIQNATNLQ